MSTPEEKLAPKNYIVSSISKNLLTPCRRVGLSRTRKTPKNSAQESSILREKVAQPEICNITKTENVDLDITPKECSNITKDQLKINYSNKNGKTKNEPTEFTSKCQPLKSNIYVPEVVHVNPDLKLQSKSHSKEADPKGDSSYSAINPTPAIYGSPPDSPTCSPVISIVKVQVHHPIAKRNLNFNNINESKNLITFENVKTDYNKVSLGNVSEKVYKSLSLPSSTAKLVSVSEPLKEQFRKNVLLEQSRSHKLSSDVSSESNKNESHPEVVCSSNTAAKAKCNSVLEMSKKTSPKTTSSTALTKFTTEDYLQEYFENPIKFQEHLEIASSPKSVSDEVMNNDDSSDFMPAKCKTNKLCDKNYTATAYSKVTTTEKSLGQIKESKIPQKTSKRALTVSLDRLSNRSIPKKSKEKITSFKTMFDCSDDEMFIPSQESDRKRQEKLLKCISNTEREVKQKEQTLDRLQRAKIYKNMHSPKKLNEFSKRWIEGCKAALKDLLVKMQEHGPMELDILIKKLRIPDSVVDQLKF